MGDGRFIAAYRRHQRAIKAKESRRPRSIRLMPDLHGQRIEHINALLSSVV